MFYQGFRMQGSMCMGMMNVQASLRSLAACPNHLGIV